MNMRMKKNLFGLLVVAIMILPCISVSASANESSDVSGDVKAVTEKATEETSTVPQKKAEEVTKETEKKDAGKPTEASKAKEDDKDLKKSNSLKVKSTRGGSPKPADVKITNFRITSLNKKDLDKVFYNDLFYLAMDWDASSHGTSLKEGDYFDITLPVNMRFPSDTSAGDFELKDDKGTVIANAHVTPGYNDYGGTVHVTFTDAVEGKYDVKGDLFLAAQFRHSMTTFNDTNSFSITVNGDVQGNSQTIESGIIVTGPKILENEHLVKWGQKVSGKPDVAEWRLRLNHRGATLTNAVLTDSLGSTGETYIKDSFILKKVIYDEYGNEKSTVEIVDVANKIEFSSDGSSFTLNLGNISGEQYALSYKSTYTPGTVLRNESTLSSVEESKTFKATHIGAQSGGSGSGSLADKIRIIKVDADDVTTALAGAVFEVSGPDGETFTMTTGSDGTVTSGVLKQGKYRIREINPPSGYEIDPDESEFELEVTSDGGAVRRVKNTKVSKIEIPVKKIWNDSNNQDGKRPSSIVARLYADNEDTGKIALLDESNNWSGIFSDLEEFSSLDGHKIIYSVKEDSQLPAGYTTVSSGDNTGLILTNSYTPETLDISGEKTWEDNDDQDGVRPRSITVRLFADGVEKESLTVTEADNWAWEFKNLPKYKEGTEIQYAVLEDPIDGYTPVQDGYNYTNTHTPGKVSINVVKAWEDGNDQDGIRPKEVTVKLYADDVDTGKTLLLKEENGWVGTFSDLDEKKNGVAINYTVKEANVTGYLSIVSGDMHTGYTLTNKHTPAETSVSGEKKWDDEGDQDGKRPDKINVRLFADGVEVDQKEVSAAENWTWQFDNLPKYNNGVEILYSITEDAVSDYSTQYNGFDIVNSYTPKETSISVIKAWNDYNDKDKMRPQDVVIHLYADGKDTGKTLVLSENNLWRGSFKSLPEKKDGKTIEYTITEDKVEGYTQVISGDPKVGFKVVNSHTPEKYAPPEKDTPKKKTKNPGTGDDMNLWAYFASLLFALTGMLVLARRLKREESYEHLK